MIGLLFCGWAAAVEPDEELLDDFELTRDDGVAEQPAPRGANRGRLVLAAGIGRWLFNGPVVHGQIQVHTGRWIAVHLGGGAFAPTVLDGTGGRTFAVLPGAEVGLVFDPLVERVRPQLGVVATATLVHLDTGAGRIWLAPGVQGRAALDLVLAGPLCLVLEGYLGMHAVTRERAEVVGPRLAGTSTELGARAGWGLRW